MQLPSWKRLVSSDYVSIKNFKDLIDQLSIPLNNGIEVLYNALTNSLTLRDNSKCTVKDIKVTVNSSGIPIQTTGFQLSYTSAIDSVRVGIATNLTNSTHYPTSAPFISGIKSGQSFVINQVTGLQANEQYQLRVIVDHQ